jgi:hypothetical protein
MDWDPRKRPPPHVCPKQYCFHWVGSGGGADFTGSLNRRFKGMLSRQGALPCGDNWYSFPAGGCAHKFDICTRLDREGGDKDCYEPEEHELEAKGLPWFYFIHSVEHLVEEIRNIYLKESVAWWGTQDK